MIWFFRVTSEKNSTLLRNAEISQQMEMAKRDMRQQEMEMSELTSKISLLEEENKRYKSKENKTVEQELKGTISNLEDQLMDKNKVSLFFPSFPFLNKFKFSL